MALSRTNFHFLNDGSGRMLCSFLHRDEATGNCASGFVNCPSHGLVFLLLSGGCEDLPKALGFDIRLGYPFC